MKNFFTNPGFKSVVIFIFFFLQLFKIYSQSPGGVSFVSSDTIGCVPLQVSFKNNSGIGYISYKWDFGNGNSSVNKDPSNVYTKPGIYNVRLVALDNNGKSVTYGSKINVVDNPVADFKPTKNAVCAGDSVTFKNLSQNSSKCVWDFGDGNTLEGQTASHSYAKAGSYTVKLLVSNDFGCNNVMVKYNCITVYSLPVITFDANLYSSCNPDENFAFHNSSSNAASYIWDFGDGNQSVVKNPIYNYHKEGSFSVSLMGTSINGCVNTLKQINLINIALAVKPSIICSNTTACQSSLVRLSGVSKDSIQIWSWDFGDGSTGTGQQVIHKYTDIGTYTVILRTTNKNGCKQEIINSNFISVFGIVVPGFTTKAEGCDNLVVNFDNTSKNAKKYLWEFGDGTKSTIKTPEHVYQKAGNYNVTLHAFGSNGCEMIYTVANDITIFNRPVSSFSASSHQGCPPYKVSFSNNSKTAKKHLWVFGDSTFSDLENPSHIYKVEGVFFPKLIVYNANNCSDTFSETNPVRVSDIHTYISNKDSVLGCTPYKTTFSDGTFDLEGWSWDFGDGQASNLKNPTHIYTNPGSYKIKLVAKTTTGCTQIISPFQIINLKNAPKSGFIASPVKCPVAENFKDTTRGAVSWDWYFGDGIYKRGNNVRHSWNSDGTFMVSTSILTANGCTILDSQKINYKALFARISPDHANAVFPATIHFSFASVGVSDFKWDFGDGTYSTEEKPTHTYTVPGIYVVHLTYSNKDCSARDSVILFQKSKVFVDSLNVSFYSVKRFGCSPFYVSLTNTSSKAVKYQWDFGDSTTSTDQNPTHIFKFPGKYDIQLIATDSMGKSKTLLKSGYIVVENPEALFKVHKVFKNHQTTINLEDQSKDAGYWLWNFGDGSTSNDQNPVHTYMDTTKTLKISLKVTALGGCSNVASTLYNPSLINPLVNLPANGCVNDSITFKVSTTGLTGFLWDFGDSNTSSNANPKYAYKHSGSRLITLTTNDDQGNSYTYYAPHALVIDNPIAKFDAPGNKIQCDSLSITFKNLSTGADSFIWDFGDGTSSQEVSPVHLFQKEGTFSVKLTAIKNICRSNYTIANLVTINKAKPAFVITQDSHCLPVTATYKDMSIDPVFWRWDFGDPNNTISSNISGLQNPVHIYYSIPKAEPNLTIVDSRGCTATVSNSKIGILTAGFDAPLKWGCGPLGINFKDGSSFAKSWHWDFGDGSVSDLQNPDHIYENNGLYRVKLTVSAGPGCVDSLSIPDFIKVSRPVANFSSPTKASCAPSFVNFLSHSQNALSWHWDFGDSSFSDKENPGHIYDMPGLYTVKLTVQNAEGCFDSIIKFKYIKVLGPVSKFKVSNQINCSGKQVSFIDGSKDAIIYSWNFGDGNTSTRKEPDHLYKNPGFFTPTLITTDSFGCKSLAVLRPPLRILDSMPPSIPQIVRVSVTGNNSVNLSWNASLADSEFKAYRIYRTDPENMGYKLIAEISDINTLTFDDQNINTLANAYSYKVQAINICGFGNSLSELIAHTTINVSAVATRGNSIVTWTPYKGCKISGYTILRQEQGSEPVVIGSTDPNTLTFTDYTVYCPIPVSYRIIANDICGNPVISFSDTAVCIPFMDYSNQKVDITRSTVAADNMVLTEWKQPTILPEKVLYFDILRSTDNIHFTKIDRVENLETAYIDKNVETASQNYYYRIIPVNGCDQKVADGNSGSSILLQRNKHEDGLQLKWTTYKGWDSGVDYYIIEKTDENGNWQIFKKVNGKQTTVEDKN